jgi:hypothetical protein
MLTDWLRIGPEIVRLNLQKARHARRVRAGSRRDEPPPAPCQAASDRGRAHETRCEACLRFDRASRYRHVCPALRLRGAEAWCSLDSADIRPEWPRAAALLALPPVAAAILALLLAWGVLRFVAGYDRLSPLDLAWPPRWAGIAEQRRAHFHDVALRAIAAGDPATAGVALFSAAQIGVGDPAKNHTLARLATLGTYHSLADEIHARTLAAHPSRAAELAIAWHDDLLIGGRPRRLARLSLEQLVAPGAPREPWLHAFFESIRHPDTAADLLDDDPPAPLPHPGLRHALAARAALDRGERAEAADQLLAFEGLLPGMAARRFLVFSWLEAGDPLRARAAAISTAHPAPPGETPALLYALLRAGPRPDREAARLALRPAIRDPRVPRPLLLAALVRDPDATLVEELAASLSPAQRSQAPLLGGLWLAARRAGAHQLSGETAAALESLGRPVPEALQPRLDAPAPLHDLRLAAGILPLDRELLHALREAP